MCQNNNLQKDIDSYLGKKNISEIEIPDSITKNIKNTLRPYQVSCIQYFLAYLKDYNKNSNKYLMFNMATGSGTTLAVAHKMKRQYIGVEQIESHFNILVERLKKVIEGEQGGISKTVNWKGGGEFIRCDIATYNANWIEKINKVKSDKEFKELFNEMKEKSVINHRLKIDYFETDNLLDKDFNGKDLEEKKSIMLEILDKNMFYVPFSERHDTNFNISDNDIKLSESFYER